MAMRRSFEEFEAIARRLRQALGIDGLDSPDLIDVFETKLSQIFAGFTLKCVADPQLPYAPASADCSTNTVIVRESMYQGALRGDGRARMTLAHELGHMALGHSQVRYRKEDPYRHRPRRDVQRDEWQAKRFAAVFLVPSERAVDCKSADEICDRFQVSQEAADIRKSELDAQARRDSGIKRELPASVIDYLEVAKSRGHKVTSWVIEIVVQGRAMSYAKYHDKRNSIANRSSNVTRQSYREPCVKTYEGKCVNNAELFPSSVNSHVSNAKRAERRVDVARVNFQPAR